MVDLLADETNTTGGGVSPPPPAAAFPRPARRPDSGSGGNRRLDLQGLRAVAVLLVALDHANVPFLKGGYVGVDVFFVLSGYFITGVLFREGFGRGEAGLARVSIRGFYARRVRRILPAACLTLVVTSIAVYVVYDLLRCGYLQTKVVLDDALAASLFFANWHFVATATNYFQQAATTLPSPFQHFWTLSVEEQFYFVWPSLLAIAFFICRGRAGSGSVDVERRRRTATWAIGLLILGCCAVSLYLSIHLTASNPQASYFSTATRVWELGCGAGLALLAARSHRTLPRLPSVLLGWGGLAAIAAASVLYSPATPFPGSAALLPVLGSAAIVVAGMAPRRHGVERLLATPPLTYVGDRSYTFYLWHYPSLVVVWQAAGHVLPVGANLGLLAGAFLISVVTYDLYENPLRFARWLRGWRTAAMVPVSLACALAATLVPIAAFEASLATEALASGRAQVVALRPASGQPVPLSLWGSTPIPAVVAAARAARGHAALPSSIVPSMQELEQENAYIGYDMPRSCQPSFGPGMSSRICRLGDSSSRRVVAVIGDSHAGMWMPALIAAGRAQHFAVVPLDKPGCIMVDIHRNLPGWPCANWYRWALGWDRRLNPVVTIVEFELTSGMRAHPDATVAEFRSVLAQVRHGVLLADPPGQQREPADCIAAAVANMGICSSRTSHGYTRLMHRLDRLVSALGDPAIPTEQWFCAAGICPMVVDHMLTTRDRSHLTMQYSTALAPLIGRALRPILQRSEGVPARF